MDIKNDLREEARKWLEGKDDWDGLGLLAEYGRLQYNQAIKDTVNTVFTAQLEEESNIIDRIKKLEK